MAVVKPFRASATTRTRRGRSSRSSRRRTTSSPTSEREESAARSPYNVVHLTLPDSAEDAARDFEAWRDEGVLRRGGARSAVWALEQDYVGPDGVARTRRRARRLAQGRAVRDRRRPAARAHAREARRRSGSACSGRRARSSSRSSSSTRARRRCVPEREPDLEVEGAEALADRRADRIDRVLRRPAAADRRRPPPLRDGGRLRVRRVRPACRSRRARLDQRPWARDLPAPTRCFAEAAERRSTGSEIERCPAPR